MAGHEQGSLGDEGLGKPSFRTRPTSGAAVCAVLQPSQPDYVEDQAFSWSPPEFVVSRNLGGAEWCLLVGVIAGLWAWMAGPSIWAVVCLYALGGVLGLAASVAVMLWPFRALAHGERRPPPWGPDPRRSARDRVKKPSGSLLWSTSRRLSGRTCPRIEACRLTQQKTGSRR